MGLLELLFSPWNRTSPTNWGISSSIHIDFGCGYFPRNPFSATDLIGIDLLPPIDSYPVDIARYIQVKPGDRTPINDSSVDSISGYDFIEHLSRGGDGSPNYFIEFMNEAHRVLRPGGILLLVTPAFPSPAAFQDPTHVNFITEGTVEYFLGENAYAKTQGYGFNGNFKLVKQTWVGPMSKIFEQPKNIPGNKHLTSIIPSIRRIVAGTRKPTHLLWVLSKT